MVVVDCAALPPNLLESELFGHARGAFTGATSAHAGAFEAAHGGTVFLDEVGELPLSLQPKLLRVLESRVIRRLGETSYRKVDIRVISATHRDLKMMVNQRAFREDLFFRLAVLPVFVPAFRDRIGDLPLLLEAFLGEKVFEIPPERMAVLAAQPWTGNVRELRNFAERVLAIGIDRASLLTFGEPDAPEEPVEDLDEAPTLSDEQRSTVEAPPVEAGAAITPLDLAEVNELFDGEFKPFRERWCDVGEREYLRRLMLRTDHAPTRASKAAALNRTYLYRLLRRHGF
jgi:transcriptional regulator with GAF, ATPase, and Fis domain